MSLHRLWISLLAAGVVTTTQVVEWVDGAPAGDGDLAAAVAGFAGGATTPAAAPDSLPPPTAPPRTLWLRAVGDIQLDRGVERGWEQGDLFTIFAGARHALRAADITFGNLESIAAHAGETQGHPISFRAHPNSLMPLEDAGFDVLSLANNHAYDYGRGALVEAAAPSPWRTRGYSKWESIGSR